MSLAENFQFFSGFSRRSRKTSFLLSLGDVEEKLANDDAIARQVALDVTDVLVAILPDVLGDELGRDLLLCHQLGMNTDNESLFVVATIENADPPAFGQTLQAAPEKVVIEIFRRWALE